MGERFAEDPPLFYETHVFICTNRRPEGHPRGCCAARGAEKIKDYMKARIRAAGIADIRINAAGCLDRCELGPCAVLYPEGVWYRLDSEQAVDAVIARHIQGSGRVPEAMLNKS